MTITEAARRLRQAEWLRRDETQAVMAALDGAAGRVRAVGGMVRDTVLDRLGDRADLDLATELRPDEVLARAAGAGIAAYSTGIEHGTVTLRLGDVVAEVTTLREDIETDGRHARVRFGTDWARDAARRDFTLNALYAGMDGTLFDPLDGLADCLAGRVRFIGDAARRIAEDRLRVYRFFRFSASHGGEQFDPEGLAACRAAAGDLDRLSAERIGAEFRRMLALPRIAATLRTMAEIGVLPLDATTILVLQRYERGVHRPRLATRLALLQTAIPAASLQAMWRLSNEETQRAGAILAAARLLVDYRIHEAAYRFAEHLPGALEAAAALAGWTEAGKAAVDDQLRQLQVPAFPLRGDDLMRVGYAPGPALGSELERLERLWLERGFTLVRD